MVLDLTELSFIDSTGLGVLAVLARRPKLDAADVAIVCPASCVCKLITMVGLDRVVPVYPTRDEALRGKAVT